MVEYSFVRLTESVQRADLRQVSQVLQRNNVTLDPASEPFVTLRPSAPWVQDRGWLNFIGNWHYFSQPPNDHADWVKAIAPSSAGQMEAWLTGVTPGTMYLVMIHVMCSVGPGNPAFRVGASDAAGEAVSAQPPEQVILLIIKPATGLTLVTVEPQSLESWSLYSVEVHRLS